MKDTIWKCHKPHVYTCASLLLPFIIHSKTFKSVGDNEERNMENTLKFSLVFQSG